MRPERPWKGPVESHPVGSKRSGSRPSDPPTSGPQTISSQGPVFRLVPSWNLVPGPSKVRFGGTRSSLMDQGGPRSGLRGPWRRGWSGSYPRGGCRSPGEWVYSCVWMGQSSSGATLPRTRSKAGGHYPVETLPHRLYIRVPILLVEEGEWGSYRVRLEARILTLRGGGVLRWDILGGLAACVVP